MKLLLCFLLTFVSHCFSGAKAESFANLHETSLEHPGEFRIMSYNTYFLYDCEDDPTVEKDQEFKPSDYARKLQGIAEIINRNSPALVGLQEVENLKVLKDLKAYLARGYEILHYESRDQFTGQDVALLYDPLVFEQVSELKDNLDFGATLKDKSGLVLVENQKLTKGILEVSLKIRATDEVITILLTHLKSQLGGFNADLKRIAQANTVRKKLDELVAKGQKKILLLGDLNDNNPSAAIEMITGESSYTYGYDGASQVLFYDLFVDYDRKDNYTYMYRKFLKAGEHLRYLGTFHARIDYIFASPWLKKRIRRSFIDQTHLMMGAKDDFNPEDEKIIVGSNGEMETFNSKKFPSDHFPVVITYRAFDN